MKQINLSLLLLLFLFSCKQEEKPNYVLLNGTITNNTAEKAVIRGNNLETTLAISENGSFADTLTINNDGFYDFFVGRERTGIYLEKGKNLTINLNTDEFDESLKYSGDLASENNFLAAKYLWNEQNLDFKEVFSLDEKSFMDKLKNNKKSIDSIYAANAIENNNFKKMLSEEDTYAHALMLENYNEAYNYYTGNTDYRVSEKFYDNLKGINFKDTLAFRNSFTYQSLLEAHYSRILKQDTLQTEINKTVMFLKEVDRSLPDGYAKDKLMSSYLQYGLKPDEYLDESFSIYENSSPNTENLEKLRERYNKLKTLTPGNPSPTFVYENHKGGTTNLEDLKGKYVYIDVWATWCGPCLREIPSLLEIEEDYKGKNIHFVSISIDEPKDYDKWKNMVSEKELGGIQLMADKNWKSQFVSDYAILGIPRFILIDPQGNIVSADAPRPSAPELRSIFEEIL